MATELTTYEWVATDYEWSTPLGLYWISRQDHEWAANFRPLHMREGERRTAVNALNAQGNTCDWPSLQTAKLACQAHFERMRRNGESPAEAAVRLQVHTDYADARWAG